MTLNPPVDTESWPEIAETKLGLARPLYSRAWNVMNDFLR
jgi:hypothetical protein